MKKNLLNEMMERAANESVCAAHLAHAYCDQYDLVIPRDDETLADALREYRDVMCEESYFDACDFEPEARKYFAFANTDIDLAVRYVRDGGHPHIVEDERFFSIFA